MNPRASVDWNVLYADMPPDQVTRFEDVLKQKRYRPVKTNFARVHNFVMLFKTAVAKMVEQGYYVPPPKDVMVVIHQPATITFLNEVIVREDAPASVMQLLEALAQAAREADSLESILTKVYVSACV